MSNTNHMDSDNLCELLPWYVNGTLTDSERQTMEQHLRGCKACAQELPILLGLQQSMRDETVTVLMPQPDTGRFLASIDEVEPRRLAPQRTWQTAAIAATILLAALILFVWTQAPKSSTPPGAFETVIEETVQMEQRTYDYVLLVDLDANLEASQRQSILNGLDPLSIAGPDSVGQYRLVKRLSAHSMAALDDYRKTLEAEFGISKVSIVAVELPVE